MGTADCICHWKWAVYEDDCEYKLAVLHAKLPNSMKVNNRTVWMVWQRDLECTVDDEEWWMIASNNGKYIREANGKFIQFKILQRYY